MYWTVNHILFVIPFLFFFVLQLLDLSSLLQGLNLQITESLFSIIKSIYYSQSHEFRSSYIHECILKLKHMQKIIDLQFFVVFCNFSNITLFETNKSFISFVWRYLKYGSKSEKQNEDCRWRKQDVA